MSDPNLTSLLLWNDVASGQPFVVARGAEPDRLANAAAHACQASDKADEFAAQFQRLVAAFHVWLEDHRDKIKAAYLAVRERDLLFLLIQKDARFDPDLTDSLTELDLAIANGPEFDLIDLEVMAIPPVSADSLKAVLSSGTVVYDAQ